MKTIKNIDITNKKVIIRCDFNVPIKNGIILDDSRIKKSIKTINYALKYSSNVIILSHLGRIKTKEDIDNNSLKIVCDRLSELLNEKVIFCKYNEDVQKVINDNKIVMMENTRVFDVDNNKESNNDEQLSKYFASFGDIFIFDAFGVSHRNASSTVGISKYLPSAFGFLMEEEINKLSYLFDPEKPFSIILGGSKVKDKIGIISSLIDKCDNMIIVGAMANTFLKSLELDVGKSIIDTDSLDYCKDLLDKYSDKIILPKDVYTSNSIDSNNKKLVDIDNIKDMCLDIGPKTIENIISNIKDSKTIFINGTPGVYENDTFSYGTRELFEYLSNMNSKVVVGGGDSASAALTYSKEENYYHVSTGGGASLKFIEEKTLEIFKYIGD